MIKGRIKQPLMLYQDSATSIDTPACMMLETKKKMLGNRLMIANKVSSSYFVILTFSVVFKRKRKRLI